MKIMGIKAVEQALNKYLLHHNDTLDPLDDEAHNLIEAIAFYILKKEGGDTSITMIHPPGYLSKAEFLEKYKWISRTYLEYLPRFVPSGDFYYRFRDKIFFHPKKTLEAAKNISPGYALRLEKVQIDIDVDVDDTNNL